MKYITEKYNSLIEFERSLHRERKGTTSNEFNSKFIGVESEKVANELLMFGDSKKVKEIQMQDKKRFNKSCNRLIKTPCGFIPNVGAVLAGHPVNMFGIKSEPYKNSKVLNLIYDPSCDFAQTANNIAAAGAKMLNVVNTLESRGYRINLYIASIAHPVYEGLKIDKNKILALFVKIKDSGKQLNINKIAYPLANPAFFRWHTFVWSDTVDGIINRYVPTKDTCTNCIKRYINNAILLTYYEIKRKSETEILKEVLK